jgi:hypothetical protein
MTMLDALVLPAGLVVLCADGSAQFGWQNPETGEFCSEADGKLIANVIGAIEWHASQVH